MAVVGKVEQFPTVEIKLTAGDAQLLAAILQHVAFKSFDEFDSNLLEASKEILKALNVDMPEHGIRNYAVWVGESFTNIR